MLMTRQSQSFFSAQPQALMDVLAWRQQEYYSLVDGSFDETLLVLKPGVSFCINSVDGTYTDYFACRETLEVELEREFQETTWSSVVQKGGDWVWTATNGDTLRVPITETDGLLLCNEDEKCMVLQLPQEENVHVS